jgi:hypothetical protein
MILSDPYKFKFFKTLNNKNVIYNINKYIATNYIYIKKKEKITLYPFKNFYIELNPVFLYGLNDIEKDITPFNHPLISIKNKWIAMDLKTVIKPTSDSENYEIRNENEYNLSIQRFILTGM